MSTITQITESEFDERFHTIQAPGGTGSDTWEMEDILAEGIPADRIWSLMDGDEGGTYMSAGNHWVNVYAFMVTTESHQFDLVVEIESDEDYQERHEEENES